MANQSEDMVMIKKSKIPSREWLLGFFYGYYYISIKCGTIDGRKFRLRQKNSSRERLHKLYLEITGAK